MPFSLSKISLFNRVRNKGKSSWGVLGLSLELILYILYFPFPASALHFQQGPSQSWKFLTQKKQFVVCFHHTSALMCPFSPKDKLEDRGKEIPHFCYSLSQQTLTSSLELHKHDNTCIGPPASVCMTQINSSPG